MKPFILLFLLLFAQPFPAGTNAPAPKAEYVYICTGPKSKCYHKTKNCQGLDRCSKQVLKVTKAYAIDQGRTPCRWCYPKKKKK